MKKNYVKPAMQVVEMAVQQMLAASGDKATGISGNSGLGFGGGSNGAARGRESDDWDDEW